MRNRSGDRQSRRSGKTTAAFSGSNKNHERNTYLEKIKLINAEELYYKPLTHPKMLIEGILSNGLAILGGDSKIGKSWMVLWFCLQISRGESVWGLPTRKTDVVYLALEDKEWRVQQRMQDLTDSPPDNLHFGFSCGKLGQELEAQIEDVLKTYPDTGIIFIDTLQMVRDNVSSKVNAYAQDYRDLSSMKKIADAHNICIFVVHHTRKERDGTNIFNDLTGSTGIMGVADTVMILRKEDRFGENAALSVTGRDIEEKKLKMQMKGINWEITEELNTEDLRKEKIPHFLFEIADMLIYDRCFQGTVTELLETIGNKDLKPNIASKYITRFYSDVFDPLGIRCEFRKTAAARQIMLTMDDDNDGSDDCSRSERLASLKAANDDSGSFPFIPSQSSLPSWEEVSDGDQLPF